MVQQLLLVEYLTTNCRGSSASFLAKSSSDSFGDDERKSMLGSDPHNLKGYVNRLLDVKVQKWVMFNAARRWTR